MTSRRTDAPGLDRPLDLHLPSHAAEAILQTAGWNRYVLQLGGVDAQLTRGLAAQNCRITLASPEHDETSGPAADPGLDGARPLNDLAPGFDVALVGNVLGGSRHPQRLLDRVVQLTSPGGRLILVAPNLAHADVRLALAQGRVDASRLGVLHSNVPLLTREGLTGLLRKSGLAIVDIVRVRVPAFETPLAADRLAVATSALEPLLAEPEGETQHFVLTAVRETADHQVAGLFARFEHARVELDRHIVVSTRQALEIDALKRQLQAPQQGGERLKQLENDLAAESARRAAAEEALAALQATKTFRFARVPRAIYGFFLRRRR